MANRAVRIPIPLASKSIVRESERHQAALVSDRVRIWSTVDINGVKCRSYRRRDLVLDSLDSAPPAHDICVVGGNDGDDVDAFGFEFVVLLEIWRQMVDVARWLCGSEDVFRLGSAMDYAPHIP